MQRGRHVIDVGTGSGVLAMADAARARLSAYELAEDAAADLLQPTGPLAAVARARAGAWLGAVAAAATACRDDLVRDIARRAVRGVDELDLDLGADVRPA